MANDEEQLAQAIEHLSRIALDNVVGGYTGMIAAAKQGWSMQQTPMIDTAEVEYRLDNNDDNKNWTLLDVRDIDERGEAAIEGSEHIYVGHLNERWHELDRDSCYTLMCASGQRATIAAGWLASKGFGNIDIYLGGMSAWASATALTM